MRLGRTKFLVALLSLSLACAAPHLLAKKKKDGDKGSPHPDASRRALHALNRLTFGPRPGDLQQVMAMGVDNWIDLQLHPERIDDSTLQTRLEPLRTLRMSSQEIARDFPDPQEINQVLNGKRPMPSDPALRAVYQIQLARLQARQERKEEKSTPAASATASGNPSVAADVTIMKETANGAGGNETASVNSSIDNDNPMASAAMVSTPPREQSDDARRREQQPYSDLELRQLLNLTPGERYSKLLALSPAAQVGLADSLRGGKMQEFVEGMAPKQKEMVQAMNNPAAVVTGELAQAKLLRAIYGQRQLEEVMTDFWINHFNVFADKGLDRVMMTSYERDVIRPHALGKFEDLLVAAAKSPAMLFYLDNWQSMGPNSAQALGIPLRYGPYGRPLAPRPNQAKRPNGLNENYGRELLELHTLSVNGGYSQRDVTEVAKVFTGWTIEKPAEGGTFKFEPRMHEPGPKFVLGRHIKPKGEAEGLEVLHRLATNPQTAHFISLKLAQRFVSDDPPKALVDRMAKIFLKKKGDIREVLGTLFHSAEFWDDATYRAKVKTPLEFVASAVRATGAEIDDALPLTRQLNNMGMPLYGAQPPTGYSMKAETWVSSSALLNRMNFALALTAGKIKGVRVDAGNLAASHQNGEITASADSASILSMLESSLILSGVSKQTHDSIMAQIEEPQNATPRKQGSKAGPSKTGSAPRPPNVSTMAGLLLGSPEFQRR